jgi:hypothetical protein
MTVRKRFIPWPANLEIAVIAAQRIDEFSSRISAIISESPVEFMTSDLISSEGGSVCDSSPEEALTVTSKVRNCIIRSQAHVQVLIPHQGNDLRERSRLNDLGPDII